ncbi:hypothetical protein DFH09DRAFT_1348238 [Mycena vulgaris]|nr:hypothetical protein DFH09DRAFT_1348238 [Mycena vulgaris]
MLTSFTKLAAFLVAAAVGSNALRSYNVAYYSDSHCGTLLGTSAGSFASNGCLSGGGLSGINSILINPLTNTKIHTWANDNCDQNEWAVSITCGQPGVSISAPGTSSIGYQDIAIDSEDHIAALFARPMPTQMLEGVLEYQTFVGGGAPGLTSPTRAAGNPYSTPATVCATGQNC